MTDTTLAVTMIAIWCIAIGLVYYLMYRWKLAFIS